MKDTEMIEQNGNQYQVEFIADETADAPWDNQCTLGSVTGWERRDKAPSELILNSGHGSSRFYDIQEATKKAREWVTGKEAAKIARNEYEYLREWCEGQWHYIGIKVTLLDEREYETNLSDSLWGIESDADEYHKSVIQELISGVDYRLSLRCNPVSCCGV